MCIDTRKKELRELLERLPRIELAKLPTPLEEVPRFSAALGGPRILIKRDDLTGLAFGGNKTRMVEFLMADVREKGADVLIVGSSAQSNWCRQAAAAASKLGLKAILLLHKGRRSDKIHGNLLLDHLLGADVRLLDGNPKAPGIMEEVVEEFRRKGHNPYFIRGSALPLSAISYVNATLELHDQLDEWNLRADYIFLASASSTQAGLVLGAKCLQVSWRVVGICPSRTDEGIHASIAQLANGAAKILGLGIRVEPEEIVNYHDEYVGKGYGRMTKAGREAIDLLARTEGILLEPCYTAKAMAALIDQIRRGVIDPGETVIFLHTGGTPLLFTYGEELTAQQSDLDKEVYK